MAMACFRAAVRSKNRFASAKVTADQTGRNAVVAHVQETDIATGRADLRCDFHARVRVSPAEPAEVDDRYLLERDPLADEARVELPDGRVLRS